MEFQSLIIIALAIVLVLVLAAAKLKGSSKTRGQALGSGRSPSENIGKQLIEASTASAVSVNTKSIPRTSPAELKSLKPNHHPSLPDQAYLLNVDALVRDAAHRLAILLEMSDDLQDYKQRLDQIAQDAAKPLLLVIMGQFKTGKSTFINTLLGIEGCLKVEEIPATAAVTMLSYGDSPEVVAHLQDGTEKFYPFERLHSLSGEGDEEGSRLREQLYYLEVRLPVELLKQVTLVDTPGLNSDNPHHTKVTEYFTDRADQVLWLFSYGQAASKKEISTLGQLSGDWKPIGVVNRIDEHDPEEGDLDSFLKQVQRRLGGSIGRLTGVSALQAEEARREGDLELLDQSRWSQLQQVLQEELYDKAGMKKGIRLLSRLRETIIELQKHVLEQHGEYELAYAFVHDQAKTIDTLTENRKKVSGKLDDWSALDSKSAFYYLKDYHPLPGLVNDSSKLNQQLAMMIGVLDELAKERKTLDSNYKEHDRSVSAHNKEHQQLEKDYSEYNKSGIFGGRPIFDWDGAGKVLDARGKVISDRATGLNSRKEQLDSQNSLYFTRLERNEQEGYELALLVVKQLQTTLVDFDKLLDNQEEAKAEAGGKTKELYWTTAAKPAVENLVGWELGALAASIKRKAGMGNVSIPEMLPEALALLLELEQRLLDVPAAAFLEEIAVTSAAKLSTQTVQLSTEDLLAAVAAAEDGAEIELDAGVYVLTDTLVLDKSLRLRGAGSGTTVIKGTVEMLMRFTGERVWHIEGVSFDTCGTLGAVAVIESGKASFVHCEFTGSLTVLPADNPEDREESDPALIWRGQSDGLVNKCRFHNSYGAIALTDSSTVTIESSLFWNQHITAVYAEGSSSVEIRGSEITHSKAGVFLVGSSRGHVENNRLWYNTNGIIGSGEARLHIQSNDVMRNGEDGIKGMESAFLNILGNLCQANTRGICLLDSAGGYVAANVCIGNISCGINYETEGRLVVEMNSCNLNGEAGIIHAAAGPSLLIGNECDNNFQHGMYISGTGAHEIEGNRCHHNHDSGITVRGSASLAIKFNKCSHNTFGIITWEQVQAKHEGNECSHNSAGGIFAGDRSEISVLHTECNNNKIGIVVSYNAVGNISESTCENNQIYGIGFGERSTGRAVSNVCQHNGEAGIGVIEQANVELQTNACHQNKLAGICFSGESKGKASQNKCSANESGIQLMQKASPLLTKNECFRNRQDGIGYYDESMGKASENQCHRNDMDGIFATGECAPLLEKNVSESNKNSGISVNAMARPTISNNVLKHNEGFGIQLDGQASPVLQRNKFQSNKIGEMSR